MIALAQASASVLPPRQPTITNKPELAVRKIDARSLPESILAPHAGALHKRFNVVCGYIDGNPLMPAVCNPGSHCAVDKALGAVGCCPDEGPCDTGIFTGCVDMTGPPPEKVDPLVYVCGAGQVCYKNNYEGGYSQFGCGTPGSPPATVLVNVAGQPPIDIQQVNIKANPTSDGGAGAGVPAPAQTTTSESNSQSKSPEPVATPKQLLSSSSSSSSSSALSTTPTPATPYPTGSRGPQTLKTTTTSTTAEEAYGMASEATVTATTEAPKTDKDTNHADVGAVVGSTLSGIAAFLALGAVGFYYYRKKKQTQSPTPPPNEKSMSSPTSSHGSFMTSSSQADNSPTSMTEPMFLVDHDFPLPPVGAAVSSNHKQNYGHDGGYPMDIKTDFDHPNNIQPTVITTATAGGPGAKSAKDNTMSYASSTYSRYLQPGALPSPTSPYSDSGLDLAREVDDFQNSYIAALGDIREESESSYSRNSVPPVPPMPQKPDSAWV
ncbi:hypothetical protein Cpir12675_006235 [Ceratocystis pirilliformis]|uniref:Uncharacterized protein n=1 Tax=Ceratocystis pirilliformis TaxID=259994 RepID=A0ABR3YK88_9PEZI